jgi:4-amino-4-deoxy-L-arabinose transferase-like glycosyltransferase
MPFIAILGLSEFSTRFVGALFGSLSIISVYFMVRKFTEETNPKINSENISLLSSFVLAVSPWHIALSRGAFEANLTTFFMATGVLLFLIGLKKSPYLYLSMLFFGLNLFSYHSARLVTPLIVLFLIVIFRKKVKSYPPYGIFAFFCILTFYIMVSGGSSRAADVAIFNPTDQWKAVADRRFEAVWLGLPDTLARIFSNKVIYVFVQFKHNYLTYLSSSFLFLQGAGEATYGMNPGRGVLYAFEIIFLVSFALSVIKSRSHFSLLLIFWVLVGFVPAALSKGNGFAANRAAVVMPAIQIMVAIGIVYLYESSLKYKKLIKYKSVLVSGIFALYAVSSISLLEDYFYHAPYRNASSMNYGWEEVTNFLTDNEENYENILVSRSFSESQIFIAFYLKKDPTKIQEESKNWLLYEQKKLPFLDQLGTYSMGKYTFKDINKDDLSNPKTLIISKPSDFPPTINPIKKVLYPNNREAFYIVEAELN